MHGSRRFILLTAVVVVLAGAGCQQEQGGGGQAASTGPVKIGASLSLTGSYERTGKNLKNGYDLWVEHVNARGGLQGRQVQLTVLDDQSEPETAARLYEKLISQDRMELLMGPYSTPVTLSATTVTEKHQFPMLVAGASGSEIWGRGYKNVFGLYTLAATYSHGALEVASKQGYKTVAIVHEDTAFTVDVAKGAEEKAKELGLQVIFKEAYPKTQTDFSTVLTKVKSSGAEILIGGTYLPASVAMVRQAKELGYTPKVLFFTVGPGLPDFAEGLGPLAENVMGDTQWESAMKAEGIEEFITAYKAKYGEEPGYHAAGAYAAGQILEAVVKQADGLDKDKLREAFQSAQVGTIFGPWRVDETGKNIGKPTFLIQYQDNQRKVVWPDEFASAQPRLAFTWGS